MKKTLPILLSLAFACILVRMLVPYWMDLWPALVVLGSAGLYVWYGYRWSLKHPLKICPICNGTKRVPNEHLAFVVCHACDEDGRVNP